MKRLFLMPVVLIAFMLLLFVSFTSKIEVEAYSWQNDATMTLTNNGVEVTPDTVYDGSSGNVKMKIYTIRGGESYTLTTSNNNDYAVFFKVVAVRIVDEYENYDWPSVKVTFDNVTIQTKNPVQELVNTNSSYAGVYFYGVENTLSLGGEFVAPTVEMFLKGNNVIELTDVKDDQQTNKWSALSITNCGNFIVRSLGITESSLSLKVDLASAAGEVYGVSKFGSYSRMIFGYDYYEKDENQGAKVNLNIFAKAINKSTSEEYGDGFYSDNSALYLAYFSENEIIAGECGINTYSIYGAVETYGKTTIRAKKLGINTYNSGVRVENDLTITSFLNESGNFERIENGIYAKENVVVNSSNFTILAQKQAIRLDKFRDISFDPYYDTGSRFELANNSVAIIEGGYVLNEGTEELYAINTTAANSYITVNYGCSLTIRAAYRAMVSSWYSIGGELNVTTSEYFDGCAIAISRNISFYQYNFSSGIYNAKIDINVASSSAALGGTFYIDSLDVLMKAKDVAIGGSASIYRNNYAPVATYQSNDGENYSPFETKNTMPYFTTRPISVHVCANDTYRAFKQNDDQTTHSAKCLACDNIITENCNFEFAFVNNPTSTMEGAYFYKCDVCDEYKTIVIPAHECADYCTSWIVHDTAHEGICTKEGCGVTFFRDHAYGEWVRINHLIKEKTCTYCAHKVTEDIHKNVTHIEDVLATCTSVGVKEAWYCSDDDCKCFYEDSNLTQKISVENLTKPTIPHNFQHGKCVVCGFDASSMTFIHGDSTSTEGKKYIVIAKAGSKTYAMGKTLNPDGSRTSVEVVVNEDGSIEIVPTTVEVFTFERNPISTYLVNSGYMAVVDGKIVVYQKQLANLGLNEPISYYESFDYGAEEYEGELFSRASDDFWDRSYIYFDEATSTFKTTKENTNSVLLYQEACRHDDGLHHQIHVNPTCIEQGTKEYWYCECCNKFYVNNNLVVPFKLPEKYHHYEEYFTIRALGHDYDEDGICKNCTMKRPIYYQVTSTESLKQMPVGTSYIIVIKDGEKNYAMFLPYDSPYIYDDNDNEIFDVLENDLDENNVPNGIKGTDLNKNGVEDYLEDLNGDGVVDIRDWEEIVRSLISKHYERMNLHPNFVEVTIREDGTIAPIDEEVMEFYLQPSGPWGKIGNEYHDGGEKPLERKRAESDFTPISEDSTNWWAMYVPNYWVFHANDLGYWDPQHLSTDYRTYGDYLIPGVVDFRNWYIDIKADGTACMVTGYQNQLYEEATLRLITYTKYDETIKTVGAFMPTTILNFTIESSLPVYLYASIPSYAHTHTLGDWTDDLNGSHFRECTSDGCSYIERAPHTIGEWEMVNEKMHQRTCSVCNSFEQEEHLFGNLVKIDDATHQKECLTCGYKVTENHEFDDWMSYSDTEHNHECACGHTESEAHTFGDAKIIKEPTHEEDGLKQSECTKCGEIKEEVLAKLTDHAFGNWILNDRDKTEHLRRCVCGETEYAKHSFGASVVIKEATHTEEGTSRITCTDCGYYIETTIPKTTEHSFFDWYPEQGSLNKHVRYCECGANEVAECIFDDGKIETEATFETEGVKVYTCGVCGRTKHETIEKLVSTDKIENVQYHVSINVPANSDATLSTNVTVDLKDVTYTVTPQTKGKIEVVVGENAEVVASYDISLLRDGAVYQPGGKVEVTLKIPENLNDFASFSVVFIDDAGNVTMCESRVNSDGTITFVTDHFSQYAIVGVLNETVKKSGCGSCNKANSIIFMIASISLLALVLRKKH